MERILLAGYETKFTLNISGNSEKLIVLDYEYQAGLSKLYCCELNFICENADLDYWAFIHKSARIDCIVQGTEHVQYINGIITEFTQLGRFEGKYYAYQLKIEPRITYLQHQERTEVYLNKTIPEIIESLLKKSHVSNYEFNLTEEYIQRPFVCQFIELDFNFISRWLEHEGIYYYFEQSDEDEKIVFTDRNTSHQYHKDFEIVKFNQENITTANQSSLVVSDFNCKVSQVAQTLTLKGYNYNDDANSIEATVSVSEHGFGKIDLYDENILFQSGATRIAKIRAQEISCQEQIYNGLTIASGLLPGYRFKLSEHFRQAYNQDYLVTDIFQAASQKQAVLAYVGVSEVEDNDDSVVFSTKFKAISNQSQFRPKLATPIKRIDGIIPALLDSETSGKYAQLDDQGRYKIRLLHSNKPDGQASGWVRKMESYLGDEYGIHFPLHKETEVCIAFEFGNPDRPIIMGAVHNSTEKNVLTSKDQKNSIIKTAGGHTIVMGDQEGQEFMYFASANKMVEMAFGDTEAALKSCSN